jgi:hypothetical protein
MSVGIEFETWGAGEGVNRLDIDGTQLPPLCDPNPASQQSSHHPSSNRYRNRLDFPPTSARAPADPLSIISIQANIGTREPNVRENPRSSKNVWRR